MNLIVFDMEWNQPFSAQQMVKNPVRLSGEIIQIGAVKLNERLDFIDTFKIMVTPKHYTKLTRRVSKLTHITSTDLLYGFPFKQAIKQFRKWCGEDFVFITWGDDDIGVLKDNLALYRLDDSWLPMSYDFQLVFDCQITKEGRQIALTDAVEYLKIKGAEAHDALNDAVNTAQVCRYLDMKTAFNEYETYRKKHKKPAAESKKNYKGKYDILKDSDLRNLTCEKCGEIFTVTEPWIGKDKERYVSAGKCRCGEEYFIRMRIKKKREDLYKAGIIVYPMDETYRERYQRIFEKYKKYEESKKNRKSDSV